jgi:transposase-like protein
MGKVQLEGSINQAYNRIFDEALKRSIVERFEKKQISIKEICELYQVTRTSVYNWINQYSKHQQSRTKLVLQMESDAYNLKELKNRIAELERVVGQKQLRIDYLEKLIEIGETALGIDLKKNLDTQPLTGSKSTTNSTNTA